MTLSPRIAYADLDAAPLVAAADATSGDVAPDAAVRLASELFLLRSPRPLALADLVLHSTGPFARLCAAQAGRDGTRLATAASELRAIGAIAHADLDSFLTHSGLVGAEAETDHVGDLAMPPAAAKLRAKLATADDWGSLVEDIADFHAGEGVGPLATRRVLRWGDGGLVGIDDPDRIRVDDLIGGQERRDVLARSLHAFVNGGPSLDALLYGPPGTGKSTVARALADHFAPDGLRLIQVDRRHLGSLRDLLSALSGGPRCLILLDDLVFDEGDRTDRELRGVLEGDVQARPENVVVWATSNRMRLLHESRTDREEDLESDLGRGERSALATRFAIRVAFPSVLVDEYLAIATGLVARRLGHVPIGLEEHARRYAVDRGLTPRAARQFADRYVADSL
jgi:predicted AAA+ superfamily ATPase